MKRFQGAINPGEKFLQHKTGGIKNEIVVFLRLDIFLLDKLVSLIRTYFNLGGHHIQFNVVDSVTLRSAQAEPDAYRNLLVRVAGYSDYFVDLDRDHQEEIISRTEQMFS